MARAHLSGINPFGPILEKEMRVSARRKRTYLLRVGYLGFLLLLLFMVYSATIDERGAGAAMSSQRTTELGMGFFMCFSMFSIWAMGIIGPVLTSTAIGSERMQKTMHVLLMTPISAWQIVAGKLFSRLLIALMLLGLSLPALAVVRLLGGIEIEQMVAVLCVAAALALSSAALGLFFSTMINRAYAVILLSYAVQFVVYVILPIAIGSLAAAVSSRMGGIRLMAILATCDPYILAPMLPQGILGMGVVLGADIWAECVIIQCAIAFLLLLASALIVRRRSRSEGEAPAMMPSLPRLSATAPPPLPAIAASGMPAAPALSVPSITRASGRVVSNNPILWREIRRPLMPKLWQRLLAIVFVAFVLVVCYASAAYNNLLKDADSQIFFAIMFNAGAWIIIAVLSATVIAQEKEGDTWTLLMAAPVSGSAIVWGKALGALRRLQWPMAIVLVHLLIFWMAGVISVSVVGLVLWVILTFNTLWLATGIYFSLRMRNTTSAVVFNLLMAPLLYGLPFGILTVMSNMHYPLRGIEENVGWYFPYYYLSTGIHELSAWKPGSLAYISDPAGAKFTIGAFLQAAFAVGSLYLLVALYILLYISRRLNRFVGRADQKKPLKKQRVSGNAVVLA